jgi:hypothetical protein
VAAGQPRGGPRHSGEVQRPGGHQARQALVRGAFKTRQVWGIAGQLGLLARPQGQPSIADGWFSEVGAYFTGAGALKANPDPKTYITDEYMQLAAGLDK